METNQGAADESGKIYTVLVNDEEQHSLWPAKKPAPAGWTCVGVYGSKAECLSYVEENWRDITPRSVRDRLRSK